MSEGIAEHTRPPGPAWSGENSQLYRRLAAEEGSREPVQDFVVPAGGGRACVVDKGQILRITCDEGPQIVDFNAFSKDDPRENFWSGRTRVIQRAHLTLGDQLWSTPPQMRPMLTIIADTVEHRPLPHGAHAHDLLGSRCNERYLTRVTGRSGMPNCQDNIANAIAEFGLGPDRVHDAFNIFMTTGVDDEDRVLILPTAAKQGDFMELYAEIPCIVALSACPGAERDPEMKPVRVNIFGHNLDS